jgi:glycerate dehydrogenase
MTNLKIVVLDAKTLGDDLDMSALADFGDVVIHQTTEAEETLERIREADIIITNKVVITSKMMNESARLKLICIAATGMNNVDLDHASIKGITVRNVAGYSTKSVVQHTFAMALYLLEKLSYYDHNVKSGAWSHSGLFTNVSHPFFEISGKKWGIIGFGAIGQEVAGVATAFGADVYYHSTSGKNLKHAYPHIHLESILGDCDIISIHAPLNEDTLELINENNLYLIKENAILLNLGRGGIINETDLAFELDRKQFYTGLDVLTKEPIDSVNPLMHIKHPERLLITPHIAWTSIEARRKLFEGILHNIQTFLKNTENQ